MLPGADRFPSVAATVTLVVLVWLKRADDFVGLWQALTDKTQKKKKKTLFSLPLPCRCLISELAREY